ncbi:MAG: hypothetical protein IJ532_08335 [Alphaproteobacteria bacterium]|nr:hypothetical protein [Alphaproteobacteria bacterium]
MEYLSVKTAYNELKELSSTGKAYPAEGAIFLIKEFKQLFIGCKLEKILNTWITDIHFSFETNQILQQNMADDIEWEGPFVFIINGQKLFIDFSAPKHYEIGINFQSIVDIVDISSVEISKLKKYRHDGYFVDISFLYDSDVIEQTIKDISVVTDNRYPITHLSAVIIELQNNVCLVVSEEIDNPMLRIYHSITEAMEAIDKEKEQNFRFYKKNS